VPTTLQWNKPAAVSKKNKVARNGRRFLLENIPNRLDKNQESPIYFDPECTHQRCRNGIMKLSMRPPKDERLGRIMVNESYNFYSEKNTHHLLLATRTRKSAR